MYPDRPAARRGGPPSRLPGRSVERSAFANAGSATSRGGLVGPAAEERHPFALEQAQCSLRRGLASVMQRRTRDEDGDQAAAEPAHPEERHRDVEAFVGARGSGRRAPSCVAPAARRRGCGRPPSVSLDCRSVNDDHEVVARDARALRTSDVDGLRPGDCGFPGAGVVPHEDGAQPRRLRPRARARRRPPTPARSRRGRRGTSRPAGAGRREIRCSTPAVRSWAASSGGRRSVLSGTSTAPIRITADRGQRPLAPVGHEQADACALADARPNEVRGRPGTRRVRPRRT